MFICVYMCYCFGVGWMKVLIWWVRFVVSVVWVVGFVFVILKGCFSMILLLLRCECIVIGIMIVFSMCVIELSLSVIVEGMLKSEMGVGML